MLQGFEADPVEVAEMGVLAGEIGERTLTSHRYITDHAGLSEVVPGQILQRLAPFVTKYQEGTRRRQVHLAAACCHVGNELQRAAWLYADQEKENYVALNAHTDLVPGAARQPGTTDNAAVGRVHQFDGAADYGLPEGIAYPPPNPAIDDTREAIDEAAGWLGEIDRFIYELTEWSPLNEATMPISGNWNEIRRLGDAYDTAGTAMESAAESFDAGIRRVDAHWNGAAAQAFSDYSARLVEAMYWEGPCGRTVSVLCEKIAEQIRAAVRTVIGKIVEMLESEVALDTGRGALKFLIKKVPVIGTAWQVESVIEILWKAMDLTMELVAKIEKVVDDFGQFLEVVIDPAGHIDRTVDETLRPLNDLFENTQIAVDAAKTADIRPLLGTPVGEFTVGDEPWRDA